jgi:hypothetical protein
MNRTTAIELSAMKISASYRGDINGRLLFDSCYLLNLLAAKLIADFRRHNCIRADSKLA